MEVTDIVLQGNGILATFDDGSVGSGVFVVADGQLTLTGLSDEQLEAVQRIQLGSAIFADPRLTNEALIDLGLMAIQNETNKIDIRATDGLLGAENSLAFRIEEIEKHFHNKERWYGRGAGNLAEENNTTAWSIASGAPAGTFGTLTQLSVPNTFPQVKYDVHRIFISGVGSNNNTYLIRFSCGPTLATVSTITTVPYRVATPSQIFPIEAMFPRQPTTHGLWVSVASANAGSAIDFIIGLHTYVG